MTEREPNLGVSLIEIMKSLVPRSDLDTVTLCSQGFAIGPARFIEIIGVPDGTAPEAYRKEWVGAIIPGAREATEKLYSLDWQAMELVITPSSTRWVVAGSTARIALVVKPASSTDERQREAFLWFQNYGPQQRLGSSHDYLIFPGEAVRVLDVNGDPVETP